MNATADSQSQGRTKIIAALVEALMAISRAAPPPGMPEIDEVEQALMFDLDGTQREDIIYDSGLYEQACIARAALEQAGLNPEHGDKGWYYEPVEEMKMEQEDNGMTGSGERQNVTGQTQPDNGLCVVALTDAERALVRAGLMRLSTDTIYRDEQDECKSLAKKFEWGD